MIITIPKTKTSIIKFSTNDVSMSITKKIKHTKFFS